MTPKQKIGKSMREIRDSLNELDKLVKTVHPNESYFGNCQPI